MTEKQWQLAQRQADLDRKKRSLRERRASLPEQQKQIDADLHAQQTTSEKSGRLRQELKRKQRAYADLKASLVQRGLLSADDFPDR